VARHQTDDGLIGIEMRVLEGDEDEAAENDEGEGSAEGEPETRSVRAIYSRIQV
jgi:hypothetical protein